jgi:hypothetical protein
MERWQDREAEAGENDYLETVRDGEAESARDRESEAGSARDTSAGRTPEVYHLPEVWSIERKSF